jgi:hypothetical protein
MTNPKHLQILQQGVEAWNAWREQNWNITPYLFGADLRGADLNMDPQEGTCDGRQ